MSAEDRAAWRVPPPAGGGRHARAADGDRDARPEAGAGRGICEALQGMDRRRHVRKPAGRSPAAREGGAGAQGCDRPPRRRSQGADLLRGHAQVLPRAGRRHAAGVGGDDWPLRRGPRSGGCVGLIRAEHEGPPAEPRQPREDRRPARTERTAGASAHRDHQAELPRDRRAAQQRDRSTRDVDGTGLPAGGRDLAAHQPDPRQRVRFGDAGGRRRRTRSRRRLVLPRVGGRSPDAIDLAARAGSARSGAGNCDRGRQRRPRGG